MQYRVVMKKSALHLEGVTIWGNFWARCTAKALRSISYLDTTVLCIMKQIYECALFLRSYGEGGFVSIYGPFCVIRTRLLIR